MEPPNLAFIRSRSRRQAMDWGLVLASQEIEATIDRVEGRWGVLVNEEDFSRANAVLQQWQTENRGWQWRHKLPISGLVFHWGSVLWALGIIAIYYWSTTPGIKDAGMMDSKAVGAGQWWRLFTAVTLHADLPHLISNASAGLILLGLSMPRYGAGVALLAAFLAGAAGNAIGLALYSEGHRGLGASGMVMGALGLLAVQSVAQWRKYRPAARVVLRAIAAAILILVLLGFSPESDILAHVGGFLAGAMLGFALSWIRPQILQETATNMLGAILLLTLIIVSWRLALS